MNIQYHGLYQVQILPAEPREIDTSEIDMALLQQIEKTDVVYHLFNGNEQERNPFPFTKEQRLLQFSVCDGPFIFAGGVILLVKERQPDF